MRVIFKALTDPGIPANEGCFRPLEVICPDGTVVTAARPAPTSIYWESMDIASDLIWRALAPVLPERLTMGHFLSVCGTVVSGTHPDTGDLFILVEPQAGGWGAGANRDGANGLVAMGDGETYTIPIEVCETRFGVQVEQLALNICDGGAGRYRGGRGLVREYRITADEAYVTGTFGRHKVLPWGMAGGHDGSPNYMEFIHADGTSRVFGKVAQIPAEARRDGAVGDGDRRRLRRPAYPPARRSPARRARRVHHPGDGAQGLRRMMLLAKVEWDADWRR